MFPKIKQYYQDKYPFLNENIINEKSKKLFNYLIKNKLSLYKYFQIHNNSYLINKEYKNELKSIKSMNLEPYVQEEFEIKNEYIFIDSKMRNNIEYPNENFYKIFLPRPLKNVFKIHVKNIIVPNIEYIINDTNNNLNFQENINEIFNIKILNGNYSIEQLIDILQTQMNTIGKSNYTIFLNNGKLFFESDLSNGFFNLILDIPNSIFSIIGFNKQNYKNNSIYSGTFEPYLSKNVSLFQFQINNIKNDFESLKINISGKSDLLNYKNSNQKTKFLIPIDISFLDIEWKNLITNERINFYGNSHSFLICFSYLQYKIPQ